MCDTLTIFSNTHTIFGKNSDRPIDEPQVLSVVKANDFPHEVRAQYIKLEVARTFNTLISAPTWLRGAEHGVNVNCVAIGNEKVYTIDDPYLHESSLIGMDLIRLALEQATSADSALQIITNLLQKYGQGGVGDKTTNEPYWSSFLLADPKKAFILETSHKSWVAKEIKETGCAISNRLSLSTDWDFASEDIEQGLDFQSFLPKGAPTGYADVRLKHSKAFIEEAKNQLSYKTPEAMVSCLRDHGEGPWGMPKSSDEKISYVPEFSLPTGEGVSICMHIRSFQATTASMVARLEENGATYVDVWACLGNPCSSIYVPMCFPFAIPSSLLNESTWQHFAQLSRKVEEKPELLIKIREIHKTIEDQLWSDFETCEKTEKDLQDFADYCDTMIGQSKTKLSYLYS